jgi:hypothetical protein
VGGLDQNRDVLHTSWVAEKSTEADTHMIIGSGNIINVKKYVVDLYKSFELSFDELVSESANFFVQKNPIYLESDRVLYTYPKLLEDTVNDLQSAISQRHNI